MYAPGIHSIEFSSACSDIIVTPPLFCVSIHDGKGDNLFPSLPAGEVRLVVGCVCRVVCLHDSPSRIVAKNLSILCKDGNDLIQLYSDIQTTLHIISITIIIVSIIPLLFTTPNGMRMGLCT